MPSTDAVKQALTFLEAAGMLKARDVNTQVAVWAMGLPEDMSDYLLTEAVKLIVSGEYEVYGETKVADVNKAAKQVRKATLASWLDRNEPLIEGRGPYEQSVYQTVFYRAIGAGKPEGRADQEARAAVSMAVALAKSEEATPLPELLGRLRDTVKRGKQPWLQGPLPPERQITHHPKGGQVAPPVTLKQIEERTRKET